MTQKLPIVIRQGETFQKTLYYYSGTEVVKAITAVTRGFPTLFTAATHGLPAGSTPATIVGCPAGLNSASVDAQDMVFVTKVDTNTFSRRVDSTQFDAHTGMGYLAYTPPLDLSGHSARMHIRRTLPDEETIVELTTENGGIVLGVDGSIAIEIDEDVTAEFDFDTAVYDLEIAIGGDVQRIIDPSRVMLSREVTRDA